MKAVRGRIVSKLFFVHASLILASCQSRQYNARQSSDKSSSETYLKCDLEGGGKVEATWDSAKGSIAVTKDSKEVVSGKVRFLVNRELETSNARAQGVDNYYLNKYKRIEFYLENGGRFFVDQIQTREDEAHFTRALWAAYTADGNSKSIKCSNDGNDGDDEHKIKGDYEFNGPKPKDFDVRRYEKLNGVDVTGDGFESLDKLAKNALVYNDEKAMIACAAPNTIDGSFTEQHRIHVAFDESKKKLRVFDYLFRYQPPVVWADNKPTIKPVFEGEFDKRSFDSASSNGIETIELKDGSTIDIVRRVKTNDVTNLDSKTITLKRKGEKDVEYSCENGGIGTAGD